MEAGNQSCQALERASIECTKCMFSQHAPCANKTVNHHCGWLADTEIYIGSDAFRVCFITSTQASVPFMIALFGMTY